MLREMLEETVCDTCPIADECTESVAPICDLKCKLDHIILVVADNIAKTNVGKLPVGLSGTRYDSYIKGARDEHAYIVEYLRGLLDN